MRAGWPTRRCRCERADCWQRRSPRRHHRNIRTTSPDVHGCRPPRHLPRADPGGIRENVECGGKCDGIPKRRRSCTGTPRTMPTSKRTTKSPSTRTRNSRTTVGGPSEPQPAPAGRDDLAAKAAGTAELAAQMPFNAAKPSEYDPAPDALPPEGQSVTPADPLVGASTVTEMRRLGEGRQRRVRPSAATRPSARSTACGWTPPPGASRPTRACPSPTTRARSKRACAARRCSRTSSSARRSPTSTTSGFPSGSSTPAARPRMAYFECYEPLDALHARVAVRRGRQADAGVRAFLHRARRARLHRHGPRRPRLRGEVLHRRRQLGPGRQQHPGVLHPGRDEVPRPGPRRQARAAFRHAPGRQRPTTRSGTSSR